MKNIIKIFLCLILLFSLGSCGNIEELLGGSSNDLQNNTTDIEDYTNPIGLYNLAVKSGYQGTYEEWLNLIKGDSIVLQVSNGYIQWKYSKDSFWTNLISLNELTGSKGEDGKTPEFRINDNFIQWRYIGESDSSWKDLFNLSTLRGEEGESGKTPELRVYDNFIQWKYEEDSEWKNLVDLASIGNGNGLIPEFSTNETHILWKYTTESEDQWRELVSIEDLNGNNTPECKTPEFREHDGYLQWKYTTDDDSKWQNIMKLETTKKYINVTFDYGDGVTKVQKFEASTNITPPEDNVKDGYRVSGWYYKGEEWKFDFYVTSKDITLTAKWEKGLKVTFVNNVTGSINTETYFEGDVFEVPDVDGASGTQKFIYWKMQPDNSNVYPGRTTEITKEMIEEYGEMTFTAFYSNPYNVIFMVDDEVYYEYESAINEKVSLPAKEPQKEGYTFCGWKIVSLDIIIYDNSFVITEDITNEFSELVIEAILEPNEPVVDWANVGKYTPQHFVTDKVAQGAKSYVAASYEERTKILGLLEKYAAEHFLTGMTMYENGEYQMYHPSVVKGTNNYIPGYGFGVITEGSINADLEGEENSAWKRYLHSYLTDDPKSVQYMNDKGLIIGDLQSYLGSSYWTTQLNDTKDGYEWVAATALSERPEALNADETGLATRYRVEVKVNSDDFKYGTATTNSTLAKYNGQKVQLEDYITPYKIYYTQAYGMARGNENLDKSGSIKGSADYYTKSKDGFNAEAWENIGIKAYEEGGKSYLEFEFNNPCNQFYAMYYLSSSMFTPVPASFIEDLGKLSYYSYDGLSDFDRGVQVWGNMNDRGTKLSIVDTWLSSGPYLVEYWENDKQIVFKRNPGYQVEGPNRYKIAGAHFNILEASKYDKLATFNEFMANELHFTSLPKEKLEEYKSDPRTTITVGDATFKLNYNTCTPEYWLYLFGENGTISPTSPDKYWQLEPAMSNANFVNGLSYAFDRATLAETIGRTPSSNYFGSSYLSDPENGISYNSTKEHADAVSASNANTNYGYNLEYARASFKKACEELIEAGYYKEGDTLTIEIAWQITSDIDDFGEAIAKNWEDAFNSCEGGLKLKVKHWTGDEWSDVYYEKMMQGQFDIGFGSISGNALNPLNFLEVLKSDNSSGFTLNWGTDTSVISKDLFYDGVYWSFDGLWQAADTGAYFVDGVAQSAFDVEKVIDAPTVNEDGTISVKIPVSIASAENLEVTVNKAMIFGYVPGEDGRVVYDEDASTTCVVETITEDEEAQTYVVATFSAELYAKYSKAINTLGKLGIDIYYTQITCGVGLDNITSSFFVWPTE